MNQLFDKEGAIERYLNGTMPPAERKEFMSRMEWDADLRRSVDTELLIGNVIRSNRSEIPAQPPESRARFLAMLATVAPEPGVQTPSSESAPHTAAPSAAGAKGGSFMNALSGSGFVKGLVATLAGVAVTVGAVVFTAETPEQNPQEALKQQGAATEMARPAAGAPATPLAGQTAGTTGAAATSPADGHSQLRQSSTSAEEMKPAIGQPAASPRLRNTQSTPVSASNPADLSTKHSAPRDQAGAPRQTTDQERINQARQNQNSIPAVNNDSLKLRLKQRFPSINK